MEWQPLGLSFNEMQLRTLDFGASSRGRDHHRVCIEPRYNCATPNKLRCKCAIAAADIQQCFIDNWAEKLEEELLFQRIGDLAKAVRSPLGVGLDQPFCRLRCACPNGRGCSF